VRNHGLFDFSLAQSLHNTFTYSQETVRETERKRLPLEWMWFFTVQTAAAASLAVKRGMCDWFLLVDLHTGQYLFVFVALSTFFLFSPVHQSFTLCSLAKSCCQHFCPQM